MARLGLTGLLILSLLSLTWSAQRIARDPLLRPLIERGADEFAAALEVELARGDTPPALYARLEVLLTATPRNWVAIAAVESLASDLQLTLPEALQQKRDEAWKEDSGVFATIGSCALCFWDAGNCSLSEALICNAPVQLTPIGDVAGLARAGVNAATGEEIDQLDLALSAIGLGATVAAVATGGSSLTLKAGTAILKMARKMTLLSPRLLGLLTDVARRGIRWDQLAHLDTLSDPARLLRPDIIRPAAALASDIGRIGTKLDPSEALLVLRHIDGPADARRIAAASEVMGKKAVGTLEVLGKSRFMRAATRFGDEALALITGIIGTLTGLALALGSALQSLMTGFARRGLRSLAR